MNPESPRPPLTHSRNTVISAIIVFLILSTTVSFVGGYTLSGLLKVESPTITPTVSSITPSPQPFDYTNVSTGNSYFLDTIIAISKEDPRYAIAVTRSMKEESDSVIQNTRASFFDGEWTRDTNSFTSNELQWENDEIVLSWDETIDPSRVLRFNVSANFNVSGNTISIPQTTFHNEIPSRALPDYTKFISTSETTITVNGQSTPAYIMHTRIYTPESSGLQFYGPDISAETNWLAFWDDAGNFYHFDITEVDNPNEIYQDHSLGIFKDYKGSVLTSLNPTVIKDDLKKPVDFVFDMTVIGNRITVKRLNAIDKSIGTDDTWIMGTVEGEVNDEFGQTWPGVGIVEYIKN